jgi:T5SS/PEP-CTERM-associated repeat protein/autotransporter-associated beta strand protein
VNSRRLSAWKTPRKASDRGFQGEKRALYCLISIAKQSSSVQCHLRHLRGTLKIVFQLKLLNARASPQLREPDNLRTFVSSPQTAFGQFLYIWITGSGDWGTASNWVAIPTGVFAIPPPPPNSASAFAAFDIAMAGQPPSEVSLTVGSGASPFSVGTLALGNNVNSGYSFRGGTLQLGGSGTITVETQNSEPDFASNATIVLQANATINTVFANSTLTVPGVITDNGDGFGLTKIGPGSLILTGAAAYGGNTVVNSGTLTITNGGSLSDGSDTIDSGGSVTVSGAGSTWTNNAMVVGNQGTGTLTIQNGATVSNKGIPFFVSINASAFLPGSISPARA